MLEMVFDGERFVVKPDRPAMGQRVQVFCPGNEVGQLGEVEDTLRERHLELPGPLKRRAECSTCATRTVLYSGVSVLDSIKPSIDYFEPPRKKYIRSVQ